MRKSFKDFINKIPSVFLIGLLLICYGLYKTIPPIYRKLTCKNEITAVVVDMNCSGGSRHYNSITCTPVLSYAKITVESYIAEENPEFSIGDRVTLFYNPENPKIHYIKGQTVFDVVGLMFVIAGIICFRPRRSMKKSNKSSDED